MSKTFSSRPAVSSRARGATRGPGNQTNTRGRGRGTTTTLGVSGRVSTLNSTGTRGRGSVSQATRGGMYSSGARGRGGRTFDRPRQMNLGEDGDQTGGPQDQGASGVAGAATHPTLEQRISHQGGYTLISPNEKKRQQISEQAKRETDAYERHKQNTKAQHVSYHGTVGGGQMTEAEARRKMIQSNSNAKVDRLERQRKLREDAKRQEEAVYETRKMAARRQTEMNEKKAEEDNKRREERHREEMRRKNNAFLDRLEKGSNTANTRGTGRPNPQPQQTTMPSRSHDPLPRTEPSNQRQEEPSGACYAAAMEDRDSDIAMLTSMFPHYDETYIVDILNQSGSLELAAAFLSEG